MKVRWHRFFILLALLVFTQLFWLSFGEIEGIRPDLPLIMVTYIAAMALPAEAIFAGWFTGLLLDVLSTERVGTFALFYLLGIWVILKFRQEFAIEHPLLPILFVFFLSLQTNILYVLTLFVMYKADLFGDILLNTVYTTLVSPWLMLLLHHTGLVKIYKSKRGKNCL